MSGIASDPLRAPFLSVALLLGAVSCCAALLAQDSASAVRDLQRQARASSARGQWDAAVQSYTQAIELAPKDVGLQVELGAALSKAGRPADAIAALQKALGIAPHDLAAELGLAQAYRSVHNDEEAKRILLTAIHDHPKSAEPLAAMGDFEIQQQTYGVAIGHLKASLAIMPSNVETRNLLAAAYKAKGDQASALAVLQKTIVRDPDNALAHYLRAEIYSDQSRDDLALPEAQRVLALQPQNARGRVLLGKILLRTPPGAATEEAAKRCQEAVAALEPVAAEESGSSLPESETFFLLSRAYRCAGDSERAAKATADFEAASQRERSKRENEAQAMHLVQQANDVALKNDLPGALDLLQQALTMDPNSGAAYSLLAKLYYSAGDIDRASDAIAKALERGPHHPDFLYVQGKIFEKQGKLDEALAAFTQTALLNPHESDAYFEIGSIYQQRHDVPRALAAYKKAVEISPDDPDYRRALASVSSGGRISP